MSAPPCWRCKEKVSGPVCVSCGSIQPPPPQADPFDLLGLERRYGLEKRKIDAAWRARSRTTHPDRFATMGAVHRRMALQWTALLNDARRVLRDPRTRAWVLVTGSPKPPERGGPALSPAFLERIFELRMLQGSDPEAVTAQAAELQNELESEIAQRFETGETDVIPELLSQLKYVDNLMAPPEGL